MNVTVTPDVQELISSKIESGAYLSANDVIREGLRLLQEREVAQAMRLEEVRAKVDAGLASLNDGAGVEYASASELAQAIKRMATHYAMLSQQ